ncbi:MAG: DNA topoisomerase VI subunit B [Candidatus Ranarchaeia archaeon]
MSQTAFRAISPADFFYSNRDIAGFDNPTRALYTAFRELVENSLDACEDGGYLPNVFIQLKADKQERIFTITVIDDGIGVPRRHVKPAFGRILYGSKYMHRQARGRFGLGGKMAYLYGQITTHRPLRVVTATKDDKTRIEAILRVDIKNNVPDLISWKKIPQKETSHGLAISFSLEGDWKRSRKAILEYLSQTALITPYATLMFIDPDGVLHFFPRTVKKLPPPPKEVLPHPYGVDIEQVRRIIEITTEKKLINFLTSHFHRVGRKTAKKFLKFANFDPKRDPRSLNADEVVTFVRALKKFDQFLPPDAKYLSPLGEELLRVGISRLLQPEFIEVTQRPPSSYSGHPFIVEVGLAYGGGVPEGGMRLYRFANRIPLIYDEYKDVSSKVINSIDWGRYKIKTNGPIAIFVDVVSTKIPFKTAGKEFIADRAEIEREIRLGLLICARNLATHLRGKERIAREEQRLKIFDRWLPLIARDLTILADKKKTPDLDPLKLKLGYILSRIKQKQEKKKAKHKTKHGKEAKKKKANHVSKKKSEPKAADGKKRQITVRKATSSISTKRISLQSKTLSTLSALERNWLTLDAIKKRTRISNLTTLTQHLNQLAKNKLAEADKSKNREQWRLTRKGIEIKNQHESEQLSLGAIIQKSVSSRGKNAKKNTGSKRKGSGKVRRLKRKKA